MHDAFAFTTQSTKHPWTWFTSTKLETDHLWAFPIISSIRHVMCTSIDCLPFIYVMCVHVWWIIITELIFYGHQFLWHVFSVFGQIRYMADSHDTLRTVLGPCLAPPNYLPDILMMLIWCLSPPLLMSGQYYFYFDYILRWLFITDSGNTCNISININSLPDGHLVSFSAVSFMPNSVKRL